MLFAKRLILQHWKSKAVPTFDMWIMDLEKILHLERKEGETFINLG